MKKRLLLLAMAVSAIAVLLTVGTRDKNVAIHDLVWSERDTAVAFEFRITNPTREGVAVHVDLIGERAIESHSGSLVKEAGQAHIDVFLAAKEEKKVNGQFATASAIKGHLTLIPYITVEKP